MDFRILGSLQVLDEGREVALGGSKQRALLAVLLLHANQTLSTDRLIDELWGEEPPATAAKTVQVHVSRLRKALGGAPGLVVTREHGYELTLDPRQIDANRFELLLAAGREQLAAGSPERAASSLEEALTMWRGRPLDDLAYEPFAQREIARLEELRLGALEELIEAKLALGRHGEVVSVLEGLIADHPFRERLRGQLILALYRGDRQADALQAYQDARRALVEELGIEPGERLRELERAVLAQDSGLALPEVERPPEPERPEPERPTAEDHERRPSRRLVSIVFADIVGSTGLAERLDPESMHDLLDRYMDACGAVIESHGGSVEGFVGDAVVGVFGQTEAHEDDALRAVRSALEMRDAGAALSAQLERERGIRFAMKLGVESGEVFVSAGTRRSRFAAGDAFNVAARLEGAAGEGEILLGENVFRLLEGAARTERLEPLSLRGRTAKVQAWRLVDLEVEDRSIVRPPSSVLVNRESELAVLRAAFEKAQAEPGCHAVTVVGSAGIGKSRLAQELAAEVADDALVLVGRCLPYGEGAAYRPLAEIVRQLGGEDPTARVTELLDGDRSVARLVFSAIGLVDGAVQAEETFWAIRKLLGRVASERPLVLVVEDTHCAEPTLLDLLDHLVAFSSGHPILVTCLAREELLRARPALTAPQPNRSLLVLDALPEEEARQLVENADLGHLAPGAAERIVETAEGNPLFLEQLVAVSAENGEAALPSSIQAVLAARLDHLDPGERSLLEHASVQGRSFYVEAVERTLPEGDRTEIAKRLVALVHKQLVRAQASDLPGHDTFRFTHVLIRDAVYQGMAKTKRAGLHEEIAGWLETLPGTRDETVGHHLGEAYRHLSELGRAGEHESALAAAAARRLTVAADAALLRGDAPAGARLLDRAQSLLEGDADARLALLPRFGAALLEAGRLDQADLVLSEAIGAAGADGPLRARALVELELVRLQAGTGGSPGGAARIADSALTALEGDERGQCRALCLKALHAWIEGRSSDADQAWRRAAQLARRAGDEAALFDILGWRASEALFGPTPVPAAIARCEEIRDEVQSNPVAVARIFQPMAALHAMGGDFDEAVRLVRAGDQILTEVGGLQSAVTQQEALVDILADRPEAAERRLRAGYEKLAEMGEKALLADTAAMLGRLLFSQGRRDEASELCRVAEEAAAEEDLSARAGCRGLQARLLAAQGRWQEAEALAREAVEWAERTDFLTLRAEALTDLSEVLGAGERPAEAEDVLESALELYRRKGDVVSLERARSASIAGM